MFDFLSRGLTVCLMMSEADGVLRLHDRFYDGDCMTEIRSIFSIKVDKHIYIRVVTRLVTLVKRGVLRGISYVVSQRLLS